jgi:hypothetical protein
MTAAAHAAHSAAKHVREASAPNDESRNEAKQGDGGSEERRMGACGAIRAAWTDIWPLRLAAAQRISTFAPALQ